ncbi:MAG: AAA family ATPase [Pseudonocardiales bacterium]|nr:AAA family ATPase [Pseudonocardiales bacterium]MBV9030951.1 AAA family ATPase [Pseudonocardiales bacterium]
MQFKLLGPLEVVDDEGRPLTLNGNKQRATLGFLLLHVNSVIATSRILRALWPTDMPATGRKMLQNAVSGLRGVLSVNGGGPDSALLLTHAPGYLLRVEPDRVDLSRFHSLVNSGRADLMAGSWEQAARTLRDALELWRGPVLTDLVESGVTWPELTTVQNAQLAAFEDYVEAELACGRYHEVISALETWVEIEPLRERLCGQLMRALYYCGRQVDALGLYRRTRTRLIEELGLDPSRSLQELERSILNQELVLEPRPVLFHPAPPAGASQPQHVSEIGLRKTAQQPDVSVRQAPVSHRSNGVEGTEVTGDEPAEPPMVRDVVSTRPGATRPTGYSASELKRVTVVLVMTRFDRDIGDVDPEDVDAVLQDIAVTVHEEIEHLGGTVGGTIGSVWLAVFGASQNREDDAGRAVRAAMTVRDRLRSRVLSSRCVAPPAVMVAVATGDALVRRPVDDRGGTLAVTGEVLDRCVGLLAHVSADEVLVCEATRRASDLSITYDVTHTPVERSRALTFHPEIQELELTVPFVNRDRELKMLLGLFDQVCRQSRTHLVTVLGEPGIGKSRLVVEFDRVITGASGKSRCLICRTPHFGRDSALTPLSESVKSYARITSTDPVEVAGKKLADAVRSLAGAGAESSWALSRLRALVSLDNGEEGQQTQRESSTAWRQFLEMAGSGGPLVVVIEDLHRADDVLLDFVDHLTRHAGSLPLLVIVTTRPDLLDRRPAWGGGKVRATTTTLEPLSDDDATRLLASLWCARSGTSGRHHGASGIDATDVLRAVTSCAGGNPLFIIEYARMLREDGPAGFRGPYEADELLDTGRVDLPLHIPQLVHRVLASRLDSLPAEVKAVLLDAAVLGDFVCEAGLAAVGGRAAGEVSPCLEYLERWEFLMQTSREPDATAAGYVFRNALVRDVAYRMIPRTTRADKHERATAWLEGLPGQNEKLLAYHQHQATVSSVPGEGDTASVRRRVCGVFSAAGLPGAVAVHQQRSRSGHP